MKPFRKRQALRDVYEKERRLLFSSATAPVLIEQCIKARDALKRYFISLEKPVSDAGMLELELLSECRGHEELLILSPMKSKAISEHLGIRKDAVSLFRYRMKQFNCHGPLLSLDTEAMKKEWQLFWALPYKEF